MSLAAWGAHVTTAACTHECLRQSGAQGSAFVPAVPSHRSPEVATGAQARAAVPQPDPPETADLSPGGHDMAMGPSKG